MPDARSLTFIVFSYIPIGALPINHFVNRDNQNFDKLTDLQFNPIFDVRFDVHSFIDFWYIYRAVSGSIGAQINSQHIGAILSRRCMTVYLPNRRWRS